MQVRSCGIARRLRRIAAADRRAGRDAANLRSRSCAERHNLRAMLRALVLCGLLGLLYALAWGLGSYALAPGGAYVDWTMQGISHDWHRYHWFFQVPFSGWSILALLGVFTGAFTALFVVPIACAVGALLFWRLPALQQCLLSVNRVRLGYIAIGLGLITGVAETIISGRNPGMP